MLRRSMAREVRLVDVDLDDDAPAGVVRDAHVGAEHVPRARRRLAVMSKRVVPPAPLRRAAPARCAGRILGVRRKMRTISIPDMSADERLVGVGVRDQPAAVVDDVDLEQAAAAALRS